MCSTALRNHPTGSRATLDDTCTIWIEISLSRQTLIWRIHLGPSSDRGRGESREQLDDFVIRDRPKIGIVKSDCPEVCMSLQGYNFVRLLPRCSKTVGRRNGYCEDEFLRLAQPGGPQCRPRCRAGSNAIVDHNGGTTSDLNSFTAAQLALAPPLDLGELTIADRIEFWLVDACKPNDILVAHYQRFVAIHDGTHGQLGLIRHAYFSHQDQVKWRVQRRRSLRRLARHRVEALERLAADVCNPVRA